MIYVTRLNHTPVVLNCDLIEHMETTPDTVISLTTGQKFMVLESAEEIIDRVVQYRRLILQELPSSRHPSDCAGVSDTDQLGIGTHGRR
jgi:flagellar protein FlbD